MIREATYTVLETLFNGVWNVVVNPKLVIACFSVSQVLALAKALSFS